jgi:hypothetical protein
MRALIGTVLVALALPRAGETVVDTGNIAVAVSEFAPACAFPDTVKGDLLSSGYDEPS